MRVYCHFCDVGQVNTYIVSLDEGDCPALIIDPAELDGDMISIIERHNLEIAGILVTHDHWQHICDIGKYRKIYPCPIYAYKKDILGFETTVLRETRKFPIAGFEVDVVQVPGHSDDSLVFAIGNSLFTGDTLQAGRISNTPSYSSTAELARNISKKILTYDDNCLVFPGHGAPTKVRVEKMFNHALLEGSVTLSEELL